MDRQDGSEMPAHLQMGQRGEQLAVQYLRRNGWEIETCNFTTEHGEIDIVARRPVPDQNGTLVAFVEVKSRTRGQRHAPELSVTARKRRTITTVAQVYADRHGETRMGYRFDVISIDFGKNPPAIHHFEGAFDASGNPY